MDSTKQASLLTSLKKIARSSPQRATTASNRTLNATEFTGDTPDWDHIETYTLPLVFPGLRTWDDLIDESHPRSDDVRDAAVTMWELYENAPESFIDR